MRRFRIIVLLCSLAFMLTGQSYTSAQTLSAGCQFYDALAGVNFPGFTRTLEFFQNEQVTITSLTATTGSPDGFDLSIDGVQVDTTTFPGSVSWIAPADGIYEIRFFAYSLTGAITLGLDYTGDCQLLAREYVETTVCPIFTDGRINHCDTFNPVVVYPISTSDGVRLDVYAADETGYLLTIDAETLATVSDCPPENTQIINDTVNDILLYRLSSCEYYLRAPMNEAGKYYILVFDALMTNTYYEAHTEFIGN